MSFKMQRQVQKNYTNSASQWFFFNKLFSLLFTVSSQIIINDPVSALTQCYNLGSIFFYVPRKNVLKNCSFFQELWKRRRKWPPLEIRRCNKKRVEQMLLLLYVSSCVESILVCSEIIIEGFDEWRTVLGPNENEIMLRC